jgi:Zn-dependent protease with chaperone function
MTVDSPPRACPDCASPLTITDGFPAWCARCEWGLAAPEEPAGQGFLRARFAERSARLVGSLYEELARTEVRRPGWDLARLASYLLALGVHAFTFGVLALGVTLAWAFPNVVGIGLALVLVLLAFAIRPRFGRLHRDAIVRRRADAPALFALLDRVADELGARRVHAVVVSGSFNASYGTVGLRRRPVLEIGLPLWEALSGQRRVALLGHELAHGVNGDARHGLIVGMSLSSLHRLYYALRPGGRDDRLIFLIDATVRLIQGTLSGAVGLVFRAGRALNFRAGQRAEYLADELAAKAASSAAAVDMLDTLVTSADTHSRVIRQHVLNARREDLWDDQREALQQLPELEKERRRRIAARQRLRVDETHPPTHLRIALLRARPPIPARVRLDPAEEQKIRTELARDHDAIARQLTEAARNALYHG